MSGHTKGDTRKMGALEPVLLRVTEAATVLSVGRSSVYELIQAGELPVVHIGRSVRVPARAVREFAERLEAEQRSGSGR